jgi:hypothetical protein
MTEEQKEGLMMQLLNTKQKSIPLTPIKAVKYESKRMDSL